MKFEIFKGTKNIFNPNIYLHR